MDRLESALLMLLGAGDVSHSVHKSRDDEGSSSCWPSQSEVNSTARRHLPLSTATSLPLSSNTQSSLPSAMCRRSSIGCVAAARPGLPVALGPTDDRETGAASPRYKTELCRAFAENGLCRYGDKCQFAHGRDDLRAVARHPKYKTDLCRTYHTTGLCPYGARCHFIHNKDEALRRPAPLPVVERPQPVGQRQQQAELAVRELELRLALLLSLYQPPSTESQPICQSMASPSSYFPVDNQHQMSNGGLTPTATVLQSHVQLDRPPSMSSRQSARRPSSLVGALPLFPWTVDSVGNSPSPPSSYVDDGELSPAPLSPPVVAAAAGASHQPLTTSDDHLTALLVLAAKLRLLSAH